MEIHPFWLGVWFTLSVEVFLLIAIACFYGIRKGKKDIAEGKVVEITRKKRK